MSFQLPDLNYGFSALEPVIDAKTMEIHHDKHHAGYVAKLNDAVSGTKLESMKIEEILTNFDELVPVDKKITVRNNGGGHANHSLFWEILTPGGSNEPTEELAQKINQDFDSFDSFKITFEDAGKSQFGSGWAWLVVNQDNNLEVLSTANQDSPLMDGYPPILGVDVWEHAYYLNYQNRRPDYLTEIWKLINWDIVAEKYQKAVN